MLSATQPGDKDALPSVLTLALFEDSGYVRKGVHVYIKLIKPFCDCVSIVCNVPLPCRWYKVDYNYSVPLKWGKDKGCAFVNDSCLGWIKYAQSK